MTPTPAASPAVGRSSRNVRRRRALARAFGDRCRCCGAECPLPTLDHVQPKSRGGVRCRANIQPLCERCNSRKHKLWIDFRLPQPMWQDDDRWKPWTSRHTEILLAEGCGVSARWKFRLLDEGYEV